MSNTNWAVACWCAFGMAWGAGHACFYNKRFLPKEKQHASNIYGACSGNWIIGGFIVGPFIVIPSLMQIRAAYEVERLGKNK